MARERFDGEEMIRIRSDDVAVPPNVWRNAAGMNERRTSKQCGGFMGHSVCL